LLPHWPPNSPDLSPIENVWAYVQGQVNSKGCKTFAEFSEQVQHTFQNLPKDMVNNLYKSMRTRLQKCMDKEGRKIKYWHHTTNCHIAWFWVPNFTGGRRKNCPTYICVHTTIEAFATPYFATNHMLLHVCCPHKCFVCGCNGNWYVWHVCILMECMISCWFVGTTPCHSMACYTTWAFSICLSHSCMVYWVLVMSLWGGGQVIGSACYGLALA
jgi:hypothetical protein